MQSRAGAMDELLASGALTDLTSNRDDIQAQLDKVAATSQVDAELAALKSELTAAAPPGLEAAKARDDRSPLPPPAPPAPTNKQPEVTL